jgi:hypothetical protein
LKGNGTNSSSIIGTLKWAQILGEWDTASDPIVYEGGGENYQAQGQSFPRGLIISNRKLQHGRCSVSVKFTEAPNRFHPAGGLAVGYRSSDRYYIQVQLGAGQAAYSVSEFIPGFGWGILKATGPVSAILPNRAYPLECDIIGQQIRVTVDSVSVLEVLPSRPLEGKQTGLMAAGERAVKFAEFKAASDKLRVFVAMEYREPFDTFYEKIIKPQAEADFDVVRIDEKLGPGVIFPGGVTWQDMQREIAQADVVIAEITPSNPNVFYVCPRARKTNYSLGAARASTFRSTSAAFELFSTTTRLVESHAWKRICQSTWTQSFNR